MHQVAVCITDVTYAHTANAIKLAVRAERKVRSN